MSSKEREDIYISETSLKKRLKKEELLKNLDLELNQRLQQIESYSLLLQNTVLLCGEMRLNRIPRAIRTMTLRELYSRHAASENKENISYIIK
ncbi:uncharacterized protein T551_01449 [Pneumocystis jirovecii RU7]|uniref:Borealin N-terminal domain-containing protein n=1 Tax=Pneumocystis jirovecii (strain RU7) TaxID=1408657 RepID=A0A0W4ZRA0_PNEJ7|nr:uncharacterized protein T551_01449 [Pneumocystis jirovecii RU7]KTW30897.1 hypothetical protein T551_01449 [Pneumocystis jirovecii RU7]